MKRTTISLPEDLSLLLDREACRHATSVSEIARRALLAYFGLGQGESRPVPFAALGRSGHRHTGRNLEEILDEEWGRAGDR